MRNQKKSPKEWIDGELEAAANRACRFWNNGNFTNLEKAIDELTLALNTRPTKEHPNELYIADEEKRKYFLNYFTTQQRFKNILAEKIIDAAIEECLKNKQENFRIVLHNKLGKFFSRDDFPELTEETSGYTQAINVSFTCYELWKIDESGKIESGGIITQRALAKAESIVDKLIEIHVSKSFTNIKDERESSLGIITESTKAIANTNSLFFTCGLSKDELDAMIAKKTEGITLKTPKTVTPKPEPTPPVKIELNIQQLEKLNAVMAKYLTQQHINFISPTATPETSPDNSFSDQPVSPRGISKGTITDATRDINEKLLDLDVGDEKSRSTYAKTFVTEQFEAQLFELAKKYFFAEMNKNPGNIAKITETTKENLQNRLNEIKSSMATKKSTGSPTAGFDDAEAILIQPEVATAVEKFAIDYTQEKASENTAKEKRNLEKMQAAAKSFGENTAVNVIIGDVYQRLVENITTILGLIPNDSIVHTALFAFIADNATINTEAKAAAHALALALSKNASEQYEKLAGNLLTELKAATIKNAEKIIQEANNKPSMNKKPEITEQLNLLEQKLILKKYDYEKRVKELKHYKGLNPCGLFQGQHKSAGAKLQEAHKMLEEVARLKNIVENGDNKKFDSQWTPGKASKDDRKGSELHKLHLELIALRDKDLVKKPAPSPSSPAPKK